MSSTVIFNVGDMVHVIADKETLGYHLRTGPTSWYYGKAFKIEEVRCGHVSTFSPGLLLRAAFPEQFKVEEDPRLKRMIKHYNSKGKDLASLPVSYLITYEYETVWMYNGMIERVEQAS